MMNKRTDMQHSQQDNQQNRIPAGRVHSSSWISILLLFVLCSACERENPSAGISALAGDAVIDRENEHPGDEQWVAALEPRQLEFPRDHWSHPDYRIEWWYYTGNLQTKNGRRFGYQLTFFRTGLQRAPLNPSRWTVRDLYTAHFAISDVANGRFLRFERTHRGGVDWAGVDQQGRVWNGDWVLKIDPASEKQTIFAERDGNSISLNLQPIKPLIRHGVNGLSRKGTTPGNASYYYSFTRLETNGKIAIDGETLDVTGQSWMDHEFSSSFLEKGQQGWDWFSIQLDSGAELMLYQMRLQDGTADVHSSGTWVAKDGAITPLARDDFVLEPGRTWRSKSTAAVYPVEWRIQVPSLDLELTLKAVIPNQEMDTSASTGVIYWEGCVDLNGTHAGQSATGRGYLEMTGYTGRGLGEILN